MLKTETLKLVRKFVVLSLMIFSLAVMSSGISGNRVTAAAHCCSDCADIVDCSGCDTPQSCRACERVITLCFRFCDQTC
jgi:hypothetical protein